MALRTARGERPDPAARLRALTRRAYTAGSGHLEFTEDSGQEFDRVIVRGDRAPGESGGGAPDAGGQPQVGPGRHREVSGPRRWAVSIRAAAVVLAVVAALTGVIVVRAVVLGSGTPVVVPERAQGEDTEISDAEISGDTDPNGVEGPQPPGAAEPGAAAASGTGGPATGADDHPAGAHPAGESPAGTGAAEGGQSGVPSPVVHVAGAVNAPGIVELPAGARVAQAIEGAGGATPDAELAAVNLARPVTDGEQVYVPRVGEAEPGTAAGPAAPAGGPTGTGAGSPGSEAESGVVDLNTADQARLETLPGVGPAIAQRILDWRSQHGPFHSVEELLEVSGIGPATLERLRERVRV